MATPLDLDAWIDSDRLRYIPVRIQIAGERVNIPARAVFNIEHEREGDREEVEFQFKWKGNH
jgi:hypothetical protein